MTTRSLPARPSDALPPPADDETKDEVLERSATAAVMQRKIDHDVFGWGEEPANDGRAVQRVGAGPTTKAVAHTSRAEREAMKARSDAFNGTAPAYVDHNWRHILAAIRQQITATDWPLPHPRLRWVGAPEQIARAITTRLVELAEAPAGPVYRAKHLRPYWLPGVELWTVVDTNRLLTEESPSPGQYLDEEPQAKGPLRRDSAVEDAVAVELVGQLRGSLARMAPRLVALADDVGFANSVEAQLVTSAPIDRLWARVLVDPAFVHHTVPSGAAGDAPTPDGPGVFRQGLRPAVVFEWMGAKDTRMWNVVRVISPSDATTEEVAATLFQYSGVAMEQSHLAYGITNASPLFILPKTWARSFAAAVKWASADDRQDEPIESILTSQITDEAALAQGADEPAEGLARKGKASRADRQRLADLLEKGTDQLAYLAEVLGPWKLTPQVDAARTWIQRRLGALNGETPEQVAKWAPVIEAQHRVLDEGGAAVVDVLATAKDAGLDPASPDAAPFRRTLTAYVGAIGSSHLADLARTRMAAADSERSQLAFAFVDQALGDATESTEELKKLEAGSYGPGTDAAELVRRRKSLQQDKLALRSKALAGEAVDAGAIEDVAIEAGMIAVQSRAKDLAVKANALASQVEGAGDGWNEYIMAAFDMRMEELPQKLRFLAADCAVLKDEVVRAHKVLQVGNHVHPKADPAALERMLRADRRHALEEAQQKLADISIRHGFEHLHDEAIDAIGDQQLRMLAFDVVVLILASIATSGTAAVAGGMVRGAMIGRAVAGTARFATLTGRARLAIAATEIGVDSVLTAGAQAVVTGDGVGVATADNILANLAVRTALARFSPFLKTLDDDAVKLWASNPLKKGGVMLGKGAMVSMEMVIGAGAGYAASRIVRGEQPASDHEMATWVIQGLAMATGRAIGARTKALHERLAELGAEKTMLDRVRRQEQHAATLEAPGGEAQKPEEAMRLLIEDKKLHEETSRLLDELAKDPARRQALDLSLKEHATLARANADARAELASQAMETLPLRLSGLGELIEGSGRWRGSSEQIAHAIHEARAMGLDVRVVEVGNREKRWKVQLGERELEIEEFAPRARAGEHDRTRRTGASADARAILHKKAAAELATIKVSTAPVAGGSQGSYYVTRTDGRRMAELFTELDGVEVVDFKRGVLVRHESGEWYFEFNDKAHALDGAQRAKAIDLDDGGIGLPQSNVATIELWGFRGMREVKQPGDARGRAKDGWTVDEKAQRDAEVAREPLMHAGHVGISFDGGKTIYGLTPDYEGKMTIEEVRRRLTNHEVLPGIVKDDTRVFQRAQRVAEANWNTELKRAIVVFDRPSQPETYEQVQKWKEGESPIGYSFPLPKPVDGHHFKGGTDYNGKSYCPDHVSNCAVWPAKLGIPIPEPSGNMIKYMPALKRWAEADAPIDVRPKESAE